MTTTEIYLTGYFITYACWFCWAMFFVDDTWGVQDYIFCISGIIVFALVWPGTFPLLGYIIWREKHA